MLNPDGRPLTVLTGDCRALLKTLPDGSVHCCVTSPPYWGLRDYGVEPQVWDGDPACEHEWQNRKWYTEQSAGKKGVEAFSGPGQFNADRLRAARWRQADVCELCGAWRGSLGLEPTPEMYVRHIVNVFREVRRVLRADGTLWLNLGDSYSGSWGNYVAPRSTSAKALNKHRMDRYGTFRPPMANRKPQAKLKPKDLCGIPWRVAFALQADGWYLRSDIIWHKPNPMPESVTDRPTRAHEYLFLLSKSRRYYYDAEAIKEPPSPALIEQIESGYRGNSTKDFAKASAQDASGTKRRIIEGYRTRIDKQRDHSRRHAGFNERWDHLSKEEQMLCGRNKRSVWTLATQPFSGGHFAVFPERLVEPCLSAGTSERGCCPSCGASWRRLTDKRRSFESGSGRSGKLPCGKNGQHLQGGGNTIDIRRGPVVHSVTTGWQPTCHCNAGDLVPCVVLDPFAGSGTTGMVALKLGRRAVLMELNPDYVKLIQERCAITPAVAFAA